MVERENEKLRKKRDHLRKVAPGWDPPDSSGSCDPAFSKQNSGILEPIRKEAKSTEARLHVDPKSEALPAHSRDVMDDLVDGLAKLDQRDLPDTS